MTKWIIGGHVDTADAVAQAAARGADIAQISLGDPKSWKKPVCDFPGGSLALREAAGEAGLTLVVHSAFVINVASLNNRIRIPSRKLLQQTLDAAAEVGAMGVVVHGGHVRAGEPIEKGQDNWRKAIDGLEMSVPLFVENTAGGDNAMARFLERLSYVGGHRCRVRARERRVLSGYLPRFRGRSRHGESGRRCAWHYGSDQPGAR